MAQVLTDTASPGATLQPNENKFAVALGHISKMLNPKSFTALSALDGLRGSQGIHTRSIDPQSEDAVTNDEEQGKGQHQTTPCTTPEWHTSGPNEQLDIAAFEYQHKAHYIAASKDPNARTSPVALNRAILRYLASALWMSVPAGAVLADLSAHTTWTFTTHYLLIILLAALLSFTTGPLVQWIKGNAAKTRLGFSSSVAKLPSFLTGLLPNWRTLKNVRRLLRGARTSIIANCIGLIAGCAVVESIPLGASASRLWAVLTLLLYCAYLAFDLRDLIGISGTAVQPSNRSTTTRNVYSNEAIGALSPSRTTRFKKSMAAIREKVSMARLVREAPGVEQPTAAARTGALVFLVVSTTLVAACAESAMSHIYPSQPQLSHDHVGLVLLPIIGTAAENAAMFSASANGKTDSASGFMVCVCLLCTLLVVLPTTAQFTQRGSSAKSRGKALSRLLRYWSATHLVCNLPTALAADPNAGAVLRWQRTLSSICWVSGAVIVGLAMSYSIVQSLAPAGVTPRLRIAVFSGWLASCGVFVPATLARLRLLGPATLLVTALLVMAGPCIVALAKDSARASDAILAFGTCAILVTLLAGYALRELAACLWTCLQRVLLALVGPSA